ncbi:hypothetical protein [Geothrix sp. 21YS21S-4]|uniref:hypothetical protein n=1 Tax=Geothrix sp. 21YS21S-4 TaxID=3068889 RepID=UPI0027B9ACA0|nr:hypothetical protein [Geothrix sp. 21YS21S-4]
MPLALEITLILVLLAVAAVLIPLLLQFHKTARGIDAFLVTLQKELAHVAEDIHASRVRMDHLAGSIQTSLTELASFSKSMGEAGSLVRELQFQFRDGLESASRRFGGAIGGVGALLALFKSKHSPPEPR